MINRGCSLSCEVENIFFRVFISLTDKPENKRIILITKQVIEIILENDTLKIRDSLGSEWHVPSKQIETTDRK